MNKLILLALLGLLLVGSTGGGAQREGLFKKLMRDKLKTSQTVLEGLALNDFGKIEQNADHLVAISNTAEWFAYKTPEFKLYTNEFRRSAEKIARKAKAKNIDGVALAYMELTMTCVRCHQYVREIRTTRLHDPGPARGAELAMRGK
jgi:cytochrome c556